MKKVLFLPLLFITLFLHQQLYSLQIINNYGVDIILRFSPRNGDYVSIEILKANETRCANYKGNYVIYASKKTQEDSGASFTLPEKSQLLSTKTYDNMQLDDTLTVTEKGTITLKKAK